MAKNAKKLKTAEIEKHYKNISDWKINSQKTALTKEIEFPSFIAGLAFAAKIAVHAEIMGHHPVLELSYGKLKIKLTTHSINGLSKNDFELAKKIDKLRIA
jgi:4a-hydroxytetrahydrobiopterin dehydratase